MAVQLKSDMEYKEAKNTILHYCQTLSPVAVGDPMILGSVGQGIAEVPTGCQDHSCPATQNSFAGYPDPWQAQQEWLQTPHQHSTGQEQWSYDQLNALKGKGKGGKGACWNCGQVGHLAADCPNKGKGKGKGGKEGKGKGGPKNGAC